MAAMLNIRLRPTQGQQFQVEIPASDTVHALKSKIVEMKPELTSQMKLIYSGRILDDSMELKDVGIKANLPMVILPSKKRPADAVDVPTAANQHPAEVAAEVPRADATPSPQDDTGAPPQDSQMPAMDVAAESGAAAEAPLGRATPEAMLGDFSAAAAQQLCEMGFDRADVEHCLQLAFGNPDRAAEYLMSGIPPHLRGPPRALGEENPPAPTLTQDFEAVAQLASTQRGALMRDSVEDMGLGADPVEALINAANAVRDASNQGQSVWQVQTESGWQPWQPGVPFQGQSGEEVQFRLGRHSYRATFQAGGVGVQTNVQTGRQRQLRRGSTRPVPDPLNLPRVLVPGICGRDQLPPLLAHEMELVVPRCGEFGTGQCVRSESCTVGDFRFRLLVFPHGTNSTGGNQLSAFIEAYPLEDIQDERWEYQRVQYQITLINWIDYRASVTKVDTFNFSKARLDRGWHDMLRTVDLTTDSGWLGPDGSVLLRGSCHCSYACSLSLGSDYSSQTELGLPSWKSHEPLPTSLLQSLSHIGSFKTLVRSGQPECETHRQGADLVVLLRDLFLTSDEKTSEGCLRDPQRVLEVLGWHCLDDWGGKSSGELLADLCAGLEGVTFKKLFQVEFEHYIECCDVDFASVRREPCYAFKLPLLAPSGHPLGGIMDSFRQVLAEELLEGENLYEAEHHGKQRARKGLRILRLPPVLFLDIGRSSFDMEKMVPNFLDTRFEFPTHLSLAEFLTDSGAYTLHTVISHDTQTGSYNAHVRPSLESNWVRYTDDGQVVACSEYTAVSSKYGGRELKPWYYFRETPESLRTASCPTRARAEMACTLVYVRQVGAGVE